MDEQKPSDYTPQFHRVRWRFLTRRRPYCPNHPNVLMITRKTVNGISHCYCPIMGCTCSWKGRAARPEEQD